MFRTLQLSYQIKKDGNIIKKRAKLLALGILLTGQMFPLIGQANTFGQENATPNASTQTNLPLENDTDFEEDITETVTPSSKSDSTTSASDETLDSWMPDKNLQHYVARYLEIPVSDITKEMLQDTGEIYIEIDPFQLYAPDPLSADVFPNGIGTLDLTGLEYSNHINLNIRGITDGTQFITSSLVGQDVIFEVDIYNYSLESYSPILNSTYMTEFGIYDMNSLFSDNLFETNDNVNVHVLNFGEYTPIQKKIEKNLTPANYKNITIQSSDIINFVPGYGEYYENIYTWGDEFFLTNENGNKLVYATENKGDNLELTLKYGKYEPGVYTSNGGKTPINPRAEEWNEPKYDVLRDNTYASTFSCSNDYSDYNYSRSFYTDSGAFLALNFAAESKVNVQYIDQETQEPLLDSILLAGYEGAEYHSNAKIIDGYRLLEIPENASGHFTDKDQTVIYKYQKEKSESQTGYVLIEYLDENGKGIEKSRLISGTIGGTYQTEKKDISGYTFKEVKGNENGQFTQESQTITYIYSKNQEDSVTPTSPSENNDSGATTNNTTNISNTTNPSLKNGNKITPSSTQSKFKLPSTGSAASYWLLISGAILAGLATFLIVLRRKRN